MSQTATPVITVEPVTLPAPERGTDLEVRVSAPVAGSGLPVIVFSHGYGQSMSGYQPLVDRWTAAGFVVLQPTHLDSRTLDLLPDDPRTPDIWKFRITDLTRVIDALATFEAVVPALAGRLDHDRVVVAGHSWGATTASALIGARVVADGEPGPDTTDPRVKAAVLLALAGHGEDDLTPFAAEHFAFMSPDFAQMTTPALLVAGDDDRSLLSTRGPDWWSDGYHRSPAPKSLLTLHGAQHSLGGVSGYGVTETTDEDPARVALLADVTVAYLHGVLGDDTAAWDALRATLRAGDDPRGHLDTK